MTTHIQIEFCSEIIEVKQSVDGFRPFIRNEQFTRRTWLAFSTPIEALAAGMLAVWAAEFNLSETPTAIFRIDSGEILEANMSHRKWLGHDSTGMHRDEILNRLIPPERATTEILSIAKCTVGCYRIQNASKFFSLEFFDRGLDPLIARLAAITKWRNFFDYSESSKELIDRWVALRENNQFTFEELDKDLAVLHDRVQEHL